MVSILGIGLEQIIPIAVVVLIISFIFFRRYFSALFYDATDAILSFLDNFLAGAGLIGLDIGDWAAAFFIFRRQKKIVGVFIAILIAWEATNLLPLSFIPVFGEVLEVFLGFFPSVFIATFLFNKYRPAEKKERKLEEEVSIAEQLGIGVSHEKKVSKKVKRLIRKADPVDALKESKKPIEEVSSKLRDYVDKMISETNNLIQYVVKQNVTASQDTINILQQGINQAGQLLRQAETAENDEENQDFDAAIKYAMEAKKVIVAAAQEFEEEYQAELQQNQTQGQLQGT